MAIVAAIGGAIVLAVKLGWIDLSDKSQRGSGSVGGAIGGSFDEVFAPARHEAQQELDRQSLLPAPAPVPGDGEKGVWEGGTIRIDVVSASSSQSAEGPACTSADPTRPS